MLVSIPNSSGDGTETVELEQMDVDVLEYLLSQGNKIRAVQYMRSVHVKIYGQSRHPSGNVTMMVQCYSLWKAKYIVDQVQQQLFPQEPESAAEIGVV